MRFASKAAVGILSSSLCPEAAVTQSFPDSASTPTAAVKHLLEKKQSGQVSRVVLELPTLIECPLVEFGFMQGTKQGIQRQKF